VVTAWLHAEDAVGPTRFSSVSLGFESRWAYHDFKGVELGSACSIQRGSTDITPRPAEIVASGRSPTSRRSGRTRSARWSATPTGTPTGDSRAGRFCRSTSSGGTRPRHRLQCRPRRRPTKAEGPLFSGRRDLADTICSDSLAPFADPLTIGGLLPLNVAPSERRSLSRGCEWRRRSLTPIRRAVPWPPQGLECQSPR